MEKECEEFTDMNVIQREETQLTRLKGNVHAENRRITNCD